MAINTRRELVAKMMAENPGMSAKEAMIRCGFSTTYARNSTALTEQPTFKQLIEKYLPDKLLATKHRELLTIKRKKRTYVKGELMTEEEELDSQAVAKGLDLAYKLKGSYAPEKHEGVMIHTNLNEYLDMIQAGEQKHLLPDIENAKPIEKDGVL